MSRVWVFQDARQKEKLGEKKCPWSAGWVDPDDLRRKSKKVGSKSAATKYARKLEGEIAAGTYKRVAKRKWADFRKEWEEKKAPQLADSSKLTTKICLDHFVRICKPGQVATINTNMIDKFVAVRQTEKGCKPGSKVSIATINRELRHIKAVLRVALEWESLPKMPRIKALKETRKVPRYVTPEHFAAIYAACDKAERPVPPNCSAAEWWRALLVTAYMTGWRIREVLALRRDNVDLKEGVAILAATETKGRRGERIPLSSVVVDHIKGVMGFTDRVFHLDTSDRFIWGEFSRIQEEAGIHLPCDGDHEHTDACHTYGFHDLRRAFATMNAERLTADALQALMRHKDYTTTQRYINMANQLTRSVDDLYVPECLHKATKVG